jgi:hypothetical protein
VRRRLPRISRTHSQWRGDYDGRPATVARPWVGDERFSRAAGEILKRRLRVKEDQEVIIDHALTDLQASLKELRSSVKDSREDPRERLPR